MAHIAGGRQSPVVPRRFLWGVLAVAAVMVMLMWSAMYRAVTRFDEAIETRAGSAFVDLPLASGADAEGGKRWVNSGAATWSVSVDGTGAQALSLGGAGPSEPTLAVTAVPEEWNHRYRLSFTVQKPVSRPEATGGVVLAAADSRNYIDLLDHGSERRWTFNEVAGGKVSTLRTFEGVTPLGQGDRVVVNYVPPELSVAVNDRPAVVIALAETDRPIWTGFLADRPGFAVGDVHLERP